MSGGRGVEEYHFQKKALAGLEPTTLCTNEYPENYGFTSRVKTRAGVQGQRLRQSSLRYSR